MGLEQLEVGPAACTWQLITVDTQTLNACFSAHTERDEMAGFMLPDTRDSLKGLETKISEAMQALGTPAIDLELIFKYNHTPTHDVIRSRPSFRALVQQDLQELSQDEASLELPSFSAEQLLASRTLRAEARVTAALSHISSGADAIDYLTRSDSVHCAIEQIQQDQDWAGHPQQRAMFEVQVLVRASTGHSVDMEVRAYVKQQQVVAMEQLHLQFASPGLLLGDTVGMALAVQHLVSASAPADCVIDVALDFGEEGLFATSLRSRAWGNAELLLSNGLFAGSEVLAEAAVQDQTGCEFRTVDCDSKLENCVVEAIYSDDASATIPSAPENEAIDVEDSDDDAPDL